MDSLERRLVELNEALMKLSFGTVLPVNLAENAQQILTAISNQQTINESGNDTIVVNNIDDCDHDEEDNEDPEPPNPPNKCCKNNTILVDMTYYANNDDFYIGVNSTDPTTIYLPKDPENGKIIIVKAEMGPPIGNRKITVTTDDGSMIDRYSEIVIKNKYESISFLFRDGSWYVVGTNRPS